MNDTIKTIRLCVRDFYRVIVDENVQGGGIGALNFI